MPCRLKSDKDALKTGTFYRFRIDVNVTSANGETQSQSYWVTVGESPLSVQMEVPEMIDKNAPNPVKFRITNMAGMPVSVKCKYILYSSVKDKFLTVSFPGITSYPPHCLFGKLEKIAFGHIPSCTSGDGY